MNKFEQVSGFGHLQGSGIQQNKYKVENKNIVLICILLQQIEAFNVQSNSGIIATRNIEPFEISRLIHYFHGLIFITNRLDINSINVQHQIGSL